MHVGELPPGPEQSQVQGPVPAKLTGVPIPGAPHKPESVEDRVENDRPLSGPQAPT